MMLGSPIWLVNCLNSQIIHFELRDHFQHSPLVMDMVECRSFGRCGRFKPSVFFNPFFWPERGKISLVKIKEDVSTSEEH